MTLMFGQEGCVDLILARAQQELLLVQAYVCGQDLMLLLSPSMFVLARNACFGGSVG